MNTPTKRRIRIFNSVRHSLELAKKIYEKHLADGNESPLSAIEGFNWDATGPKISFCLEKHKEALLLHKNLEEINQQRDAVLAEINDITNASKCILNNKFSMNRKKLAEWGLPVNDTEEITKNLPP